MIRKLRSWIDTNDAEGACIAKLALEMHASGRNASAEDRQVFLKSIEEACDVLNIECSCRMYRASFTNNYQSLFPSNGGRNYRTDVLQASVDQQGIMYVNGYRFDVRLKTLDLAQELQIAWRALSFVLWRYKAQGLKSRPWMPTQDWRPLKNVRSALSQLDSAWAEFEKAYISELIVMETQARSVIVEAAAQEAALTRAEELVAKRNPTPALGLVIMEEIDQVLAYRRRRMVQSICGLNALANNRGKGRDDLDVDILVIALAVERAEVFVTGGSLCAEVVDKGVEVPLMLASRVTKSFEAVRAYLRQASQVLERVDPHLCKNAGLVDCLLDWEESWEIGRKYLFHPPKINALRDVIIELRNVQAVAPALSLMCDDCDVGLFLCVPRIICLRYLSEPVKCVELLKDLLPQRVPAAAWCTSSSLPSAWCLPGIACKRYGASLSPSSPQPHGTSCIGVSCSHGSSKTPLPASVGRISRSFPMNSDMKRLQDRLESTSVLLHRTHPGSSESALTRTSIAWELLVRRAVVGADGAETLYQEWQEEEELPLPLEDIQIAVEGLMVDLESMSMELQRHSPEEWNKLSALLVQCLIEGRETVEKQQDTLFRP